MKIISFRFRFTRDNPAGHNRFQHGPAAWSVMVLVVTAVMLLTTLPVRAEVRTYVQVSTGLLPETVHKRNFKLDMFLKEESRYRESGLVLNKLFIGVRPTIRPWLSSQFYYANKDMDYTQHQNKHMVVGDVMLSTRIGRFSLMDRSGNEWHITDRFYRYRNYLELASKTPVRRLSVWTAEEWRFDSDQSRVNMNDVRLGIALELRKKLKSRIFFDLESNRRNSNHWQETPYLGLEMTAAF